MGESSRAQPEGGGTQIEAGPGWESLTCFLKLPLLEDKGSDSGRVWHYLGDCVGRQELSL